MIAYHHVFVRPPDDPPMIYRVRDDEVEGVGRYLTKEYGEDHWRWHWMDEVDVVNLLEARRKVALDYAIAHETPHLDAEDGPFEVLSWGKAASRPWHHPPLKAAADRYAEVAKSFHERFQGWTDEALAEYYAEMWEPEERWAYEMAIHGADEPWEDYGRAVVFGTLKFLKLLRDLA